MHSVLAKCGLAGGSVRRPGQGGVAEGEAGEAS